MKAAIIGLIIIGILFCVMSMPSGEVNNAEREAQKYIESNYAGEDYYIVGTRNMGEMIKGKVIAGNVDRRVLNEVQVAVVQSKSNPDKQFLLYIYNDNGIYKINADFEGLSN